MNAGEAANTRSAGFISTSRNRESGGVKMFKIEKKIPMPGNRSKYPFAKMEVGDSFFYATNTKGSNSLRTACVSYVRRNKSKKHFIVRAVEGGWRCWRDK